MNTEFSSNQFWWTCVTCTF